LCWCAGVGAGAFLPFASELIGQFHHGAKQGGPVIAGQLDQPGLLDEAAKLDELACSCAAFLDPVAGVMQCLGARDAVLHDADAAKLRPSRRWRCGR